ncbi:hypothetical protein L1049_023980 [Liquidambar formosana]|uniref:Uncharacterized protein n=1 Tax=Liquidambar formosana TaxID=63359 RepID=A0AAP0RV92_LIQFO
MQFWEAGGEKYVRDGQDLMGFIEKGARFIQQRRLKSLELLRSRACNCFLQFQEFVPSYRIQWWCSEKTMAGDCSGLR